MADYSSDIYNLEEFINDIKADYIDEDEETLALGIFGYLGAVLTEIAKNNIVVAGEWLSEMFPTRAVYEKNVITHAINADIDDINATPAYMEVLLGMPEDEIIANMTDNELYIDSELPIYMDDFEFHLDYDVLLTLNSSGDTNTYTAIYDMDVENNISDITSPYILPPYTMTIDNVTYIFIRVSIRQVALTESYKKIISDDSIENKSYIFTFDDQLAAFEIVVNEGTDSEKTLTPIFDGMPMSDSDALYCYYSYIDSQTIRVQFIQSSYEPALNSTITTKIKTCNGADGNFEYLEDISVDPTSSENYTYSNLTIVVKPMDDSYDGVDRKTIDELKQLTPQENLSRGVITLEEDLENYFEQVSDDGDKSTFLKKVDNLLERVYYLYSILKDEDGNVAPTNTGTIVIDSTQFDAESDTRYIINPGSIFVYNSDDGISYRDITEYTDDQIETMESDGFVYSNPYFMTINKSPLTVSVYLTLFSITYLTEFSYINSDSFFQFICTKIYWTRRLLEDNDTYKLTMTLNQNTSEDSAIVTVDDDGTILTNSVKVIGMIYNDSDEPIYYVEGEVTSFDPDELTYEVLIPFTTDNTIQEDNSIKITNMMEVNSETITDVYVNDSDNVIKVALLVKFEDESYGLNGLDSYIPNLDGYTLCNIYGTEDNISFFVDFSSVVPTKVTASSNEDIDTFTVKSVPLVRYSYTQTASTIRYLAENLLTKKGYIDDIINVLNGQFDIDFKFYNTYGPSKIYKIGYDDTETTLDKVNISLKFRAKIASTASDDIIDTIKDYIKEYIEDFDGDTELYMSSLTTEIVNNFDDVTYITFIGINDYDSSYQEIIEEDPDTNYVPEFININSTTAEYEADITITVVV